MAPDSRSQSRQAGIRERLRQRFQQWVNRRIPPAREVTLDQRRIFIFPSGVGLFFGVCLLVMLMTAINFQNNLSYGLTFLLVTLFIVAILHTYANLSGLTIRALRAQHAFSGQQSQFDLTITRGRKRDHYALHVMWPDSSEALVNIVSEDSVSVNLHMAVGKRGWFTPGRLLLESTYPLGLLRCWTWVDLDVHALVYPRPEACPEPGGLQSDTPDGAAEPVPGQDDFYGIREYQRGDSLRHIHWKSVAKGQGMQSRLYTAYADRSVWLDFDSLPARGVEQRLSNLCYWALQYESRGDEYGLRLPGVTIEPGIGPRHQEEVLKALALFGTEGAA